MRSSVLSLTVVAILAVTTMLGCEQGGSPQPAGAPAGKTLAVHVTAAGVITADGREVSLEELKQEFARLAAAGGTVLYTRDNPTADPHPNAMKVIEAVAEAKLPVTLQER